MDGASAPVGPDTVPARRLDSRTRNFGGQLLVAGRRSALQLDATAGFIWRRIDGRRSVLAIAQLVSTEYGIDVDTAADDVAALLCSLVDCGVVTLRSAPTA
jgi:Coenzyme PQQ synthesis protein D (PqqD)